MSCFKKRHFLMNWRKDNFQVRDLFVRYGVEDMTVEDVEQMLRESAQIHQTGEISEEDLGQVAGGILITGTTALLFTVAAAELGFFTSYGYRTIKGWRKN